MRPPSYLLETISRQFFMPFCGATFDENSVSSRTRRDFRGFQRGDKPTPTLQRHPSDGGDFEKGEEA